MANFTSFVHFDNENKQHPIAVTNHFGASAAAATSSEWDPPFSAQKKPIALLEDEIESYWCENVSFSMQFGESEQGKVMCSKVRLRFFPLVSKERELPQRSKFFDDFYDVPLIGIAKIEVAIVKSSNKGKADKFQRITETLSSMETVSMIRLILKDFRVVTVDLRRSQNGTGLANQIIKFAESGGAIEKIMQVGAAMDEKGQKAKIPFNGYDGWHAELQRCRQKTDSSSAWTICALYKEGFNYPAEGYPAYVVVSNYLSRNDIERQLQHYKQGRLPIWVWSRANGNAALLVSAEHETNIATPEIMAKMIESIARCHPTQERPQIMKMDSNFLPTLGKAFDHLLDLCAIDSYEQYVSREHHWNANVHRTGWLHLVKSCLHITYEAVKWVVDRDRSVILQEEEGRDQSIVVASLIQICCDPFYRTTNGLQQLIEKMWISLSHPFGDRLLGRRDSTSARNTASSARTDVFPTWLLFLDCVAQLHRIYTFEFAFSPHVLIALWDLSLTGMVPALACNNLEEQLLAKVGGSPFPMDRYYDKTYSKMFGNIWHDSVLFLESIKRNQPISPSSKSLQLEFIRPPTTFADVHLWSDCYLRWILPANTKNAGTPSEESALDEKMLDLARRCKNSEWKRHVDLPEQFSSAFPYSIPEISRPILDLSDSELANKSSDLLGADPDTISMSSSFASISFTQTPSNNTTTTSIFDQSTLEKRNRKAFGSPFGAATESPIISSMRPKEQIVGFSKYAFDDEIGGSPRIGEKRSVETPIMGGGIPLSTYPPTPARRSNTVRAESSTRPVPPPRPAALSSASASHPQPILRVRIDQDDSSPTVTRF